MIHSKQLGRRPKGERNYRIGGVSRVRTDWFLLSSDGFGLALDLGHVLDDSIIIKPPGRNVCMLCCSFVNMMKLELA